MRTRIYQSLQLRTRAIRLQVSDLERQSRFDSELRAKLLTAQEALVDAEEITACRLAEKAAA